MKSCTYLARSYVVFILGSSCGCQGLKFPDFFALVPMLSLDFLKDILNEVYDM